MSLEPDDEVIEHDQLAEEADLLTTLEVNARVRELMCETYVRAAPPSTVICSPVT
jgi:hypothetical protein